MVNRAHLIGKEIKAQIELHFCHQLELSSKSKSFHAENYQVLITGKLTNIIEETFLDDDNIYTYYIIDSIFPILISMENDPLEAKIGDWITVKGEANITLPRDCNLR